MAELLSISVVYELVNKNKKEKKGGKKKSWITNIELVYELVRSSHVGIIPWIIHISIVSQPFS